MSWYAIDAVSDAFDESKVLLFPFTLTRWLVLAVMAFFVGGSGSVPSVNQSFDAPSQGGQMPEAPAGLDLVFIAIAVIVVILVLVLLFLVIGSILEFVFVDALRSHDVRIRGPFGKRTGAGLRLLGFRVAVLLAGLFLVAIIAAPIYAALVLGRPIALIPLIVLVPLGLLFGLALAVVQDFTISFVVPLICARGGGIVATWRETLWPAVKAEWQQFLLYMVLKWGLGIAIGFVVAIAMVLVFFPVVVLIGAGVLTGGISMVLVAIGIVFAIVLFVVVHIFVQTPITVFLRYFSLLVLEKSTIEWTLHPDPSIGPDLGDGSETDTTPSGSSRDEPEKSTNDTDDS